MNAKPLGAGPDRRFALELKRGGYHRTERLWAPNQSVSFGGPLCRPSELAGIYAP